MHKQTQILSDIHSCNIYVSLEIGAGNSIALKGEHVMNSFVGFEFKTFLKRTLEHNGNAMKIPMGMANGDICASKKRSQGFEEKCGEYHLEERHSYLRARRIPCCRPACIDCGR